MTPVFSQADNLRGGLYIALSMAGFLANDTIIKLLSTGEPVSAGETLGTGIPFEQLMFVRGLIVIVLILAIIPVTGGTLPFRALKNKHLLIRVAADTLATVSFLAALVHLPLSNAQAILQVLPLTVTLGAAIVLKEAVGWRRWSAIMIGFAGVLLIIQPGLGGFNLYSLLVLLSVVAATVRDLASRLLDSGIPGLFAALATASAITFVGLVMTLAKGWVPMTHKDLFLCFMASCFILAGYYFIIEGMRTGETAFVTPFRYTILIWALVAGYFVFGEVPDYLMGAGCIIVVSMGLFTFHRERKLAKRPKPAKRPQTGRT